MRKYLTPVNGKNVLGGVAYKNKYIRLITRVSVRYARYFTTRRRVTYLTADECNKCFILRGTPPGSFCH